MLPCHSGARAEVRIVPQEQERRQRRFQLFLTWGAHDRRKSCVCSCIHHLKITDQSSKNQRASCYIIYCCCCRTGRAPMYYFCMYRLLCLCAVLPRACLTFLRRAWRRAKRNEAASGHSFRSYVNKRVWVHAEPCASPAESASIPPNNMRTS